MAEKTFVRLLNGLISVSAITAGLFILITALLVGYEVIMRYVFDAPTLWTFDVTIFLIMYAAYLGSAFTLREGKHVRLEFFTHWLERYLLPSRLLRILSNLIIIVFWLLATYTAFRDTITAYKFSQVTQSYLRFPLIIPLIALVLGGFLVLIQLFVDTVKLCLLRGRRPA
jgi:TRAP-type C4-dicarboxylate transport system permease small subunit